MDDHCPHGHDTRTDCMWVGGPCEQDAIQKAIDKAVQQRTDLIVDYLREHGGSRMFIAPDGYPSVKILSKDELADAVLAFIEEQTDVGSN